MFELMWDCFPQWCFDLRRRREASRFSGIVVSKGWWTDPNLGNLVHNACGKVCLNELSLDSYLVVHIYLWEANLKGTWGPWLPAVWGILGTSPLTPQFTQAPETSHPYRSRKAGAKSGWRCLHWMCLRNCFSSNPVAGTISNNAVFTLICSQDHLFPWAFRFHWERTSGTKMRKLMSWDRDSLIGEGKRKKKQVGLLTLTHRQTSGAMITLEAKTPLFTSSTHFYSWAYQSLYSMEYPFGQFGSVVAPSSTGKLSLTSPSASWF